MPAFLKKLQAAIFTPTLVYYFKNCFLMLDRRVLVFLHDLFALVIAMHLSIWALLKEDASVLTPSFSLKQSIIFCLIASGFFLWFQIYRGIWRYLSWRQSFLIVGVLGFASMVFAPILTKAHMQPIPIPGAVILLNWALASTLLIGSRLIFKLFYDRWILAEDTDFSTIPLSRILIVGNEKTVKPLLTFLHKQTPQLYEILGVIETNEQYTKPVLSGSKVLGTLADLPDLIENFNAEGSHPHHLVLADQTHDSKMLRLLVRDLKEFKVDFLRYTGHDIHPLTIEDLYNQQPPAFTLQALIKKNVFIFGATTALGRELVKYLLTLNFNGKVVLADYPTKALATLANQERHPQISYFSLPEITETSLKHLFQDHKIDIALNLQALRTGDFEAIDPGFIFQTYLGQNELFAQAASSAQLQGYYFITQHAPHTPQGIQLNALTAKRLDFLNEHQDTLLAAINLPYILHHDDLYFTKSPTTINLTDDTTPLVAPAYAGYMVLKMVETFVAHQKTEPLSGFDVERVSYNELLQDIKALRNEPYAPKVHVSPLNVTRFAWDATQFTRLTTTLDHRAFDQALRDLEAFYR